MRKTLAILLVGLVVAGLAWSAGNVVPITDGTETLGTTAKKWGTVYTDGFALEGDDTIVNSTDDEFTFASNDESTTIRIQGYEAKDAVLILDADEGDDNADTYTLTSETADNDLSLKNHTTEIWKWTSAGAVTCVGAIDAASYTCDAGSGLDAQSAGTAQQDCFASWGSEGGNVGPSALWLARSVRL